MSAWSHRKVARDDRPLAETFLHNARDFFGVAFETWDLYPEIKRYHMAIAIELGLKAYLLHRGVKDDWCGVHIRHDLVKALKCARRAGFRDAPPMAAEVAAVLSPYYRTHRIRQMPPDLVASVDWIDAAVAVADLLDAVGAALAGRVYEPMRDELEPSGSVRSLAVCDARPGQGDGKLSDGGGDMLAGKTFTHAGRTLEIRAEVSEVDPAYVEAVIWEAGRLASIQCGGQATYFTYGANFGSDIGSEHQAAVQALLDTAEANYRRLVAEGR